MMKKLLLFVALLGLALPLRAQDDKALAAAAAKADLKLMSFKSAITSPAPTATTAGLRGAPPVWR